jgi:very-short-patch-repair endonuclease
MAISPGHVAPLHPSAATAEVGVNHGEASHRVRERCEASVVLLPNRLAVFATILCSRRRATSRWPLDLPRTWTLPQERLGEFSPERRTAALGSRRSCYVHRRSRRERSDRIASSRPLPRWRRSKAPRRARQNLNDRSTPAELAFASALRDAGLRYEQNYTIRTAESFSGYYLVDFYVPRLKLLVEIDGGVHKSLKRQWKDRLRTEAIERAMPHLRLVRFWNSQVLDDAPAVISELLGP